MRQLIAIALAGVVGAASVAFDAVAQPVSIAGEYVMEGKGVGPRDIADAFSAAGHPLEKSEVVMGEGPIRNTGEYEIAIHLHADVHTAVKVTVVAED